MEENAPPPINTPPPVQPPSPPPAQAAPPLITPPPISGQMRRTGRGWMVVALVLFLLLGLSVLFNIGARITWLDLGGFRSEWRMTLLYSPNMCCDPSTTTLAPSSSLMPMAILDTTNSSSASGPLF